MAGAVGANLMLADAAVSISVNGPLPAPSQPLAAVPPGLVGPGALLGSRVGAVIR
jgi:hypothetical protein